MTLSRTKRFILGLVIGLAAGRSLVVATTTAVDGFARGVLVVLGAKHQIEPQFILLLLDLAPYLLCAAFFAYLMRKTGDRFMPGLLLGMPLPALILLVASIL